MSTTTPFCVSPDTFCQDLYHHVKTHLEPTILNHSLRVYVYASTSLRYADLTTIAQTQPTTGQDVFSSEKRQSDINDTLIFVASMFHDMGTSTSHDHAQRFEVCGADAAVTYMQSHGMTNQIDQRKVWEAIALHTSPGVAERMGLLTRTIRMAVKADFGDEQYRSLMFEDLADATEELLPRGNIEKVLGDCVTGQATRREGAERSAKAPAASWPWNLLRCSLEEPGWDGINNGF